MKTLQYVTDTSLIPIGNSGSIVNIDAKQFPPGDITIVITFYNAYTFINNELNLYDPIDPTTITGKIKMGFYICPNDRIHYSVDSLIDLSQDNVWTPKAELAKIVPQLISPILGCNYLLFNLYRGI